MAQAVHLVAGSAFRRYVVGAAIVVIAYYVAGKLGQATTEIRSSNLGPVWPAYGVALAAILYYGPRMWPAIVASAFVVALQSDVSAITAAGQAIGATLGALAGGVLLKRVGFERSMSRLHDALGLIVIGAWASAIVSASLGVAVLYATGVQAYSGIGSAWLVYWLGDSTGVLLITPLALTAPALLTAVNSDARLAEFFALILLLVGACLLIFSDLTVLPVRLHVLAFAVLPFIIWAAIRFGVSGVSVTALLVAAIATVETALGAGPFAQNTTFINAVLLDVFFAVLSVSGLMMAALITERERAEAERERLIREQAAVEERLRLATERERAAAALRESEDKLRLILDSAAEGIFGIDLDGRCTFCNQACVRALGYERGDALIGHDMHALIHHSRADGTALPASECRIREVLRTGRGVHADDEVLWKADGTSFPAEWWSYPQWKSGKVVGAVVGFSDITQRKHAEDKASMLQDELTHLNRVGMLSALTGALAHEINQPLAAVRINTEAAQLLLSACPSSIGELRDTLNDIQSDNRRAGDVLQRVRALLKKEATLFEEVEINSTVSDVVKLVQGSAAKRGILIEIELEPQSQPVWGDRVQVQQVVLNLLMNACDAVEGNERPLRRVNLKTIARNGGMAVEVLDRGPGMSDAELERTFEPFYTTKHDGMGLGLSICRAIVAAHGGTLEASRNPEGGMTFVVSFPRQRQQTSAMELEDAARQRRRDRK